MEKKKSMSGTSYKSWRRWEALESFGEGHVGESGFHLHAEQLGASPEWVYTVGWQMKKHNTFSSHLKSFLARFEMHVSHAHKSRETKCVYHKQLKTGIAQNTPLIRGCLGLQLPECLQR